MDLGNSRPALTRSVCDASYYRRYCINVCVRGISWVKVYYKLLVQFYRSVVQRMYLCLE